LQFVLLGLLDLCLETGKATLSESNCCAPEPLSLQIIELSAGRGLRPSLSKMNVVVEEADETVFWLEFLVDTDLVVREKLGPLIEEGNELLAICAASLRTAKQYKGA